VPTTGYFGSLVGSSSTPPWGVLIVVQQPDDLTPETASLYRDIAWSAFEGLLESEVPDLSTDLANSSSLAQLGAKRAGGLAGALEVLDNTIQLLNARLEDSSLDRPERVDLDRKALGKVLRNGAYLGASEVRNIELLEQALKHFTLLPRETTDFNDAIDRLAVAYTGQGELAKAEAMKKRRRRVSGGPR
jgi:hypothetical protein